MGVYFQKSIVFKQKNADIGKTETPLDQVVFAINRQFQGTVVLGNQTLKGCTLSATYVNQSLEAIIKILEKTFNLEVVDQGDQFILRGDSCN